MITSPTSLQYFDSTQPITIQVDASQRSIGAVLLQANGPVKFASKLLSEAESRCSNIEREMLVAFLVWRSFIIMPMADSLWLSLTTDLLRPSSKSTCQVHHLVLRECCAAYRSMMCKLNTFLGRMYLLLMLSQGSAPALVKLCKG